MITPNFVILYVDNPPASARFYAGLLGVEPQELSATFALFSLESGLKFGLWSRHTVEPAAQAAGGGAELVFSLASKQQVTALHAAWKGLGLPMAQEPTEMDFGYTFVALDPDGHRLRVYVASAS